MITFRIGADDAELFEKQFAPVFTAEDIVNLGKFQVYLSLMIDGIGSKPFSAQTMPPVEKPSVLLVKEVIESSRRQYAQARAIVETKINKWYEPIKKPEKRVINGTNTKPSKKESSAPKKTFVVPKERDTSGPYKKVLKEINEKEAELEMKKIVSPRLNTLLEKLDKKQEHTSSVVNSKKIPEVINNIKKRDSYASAPSLTTRKTNTETKSSLQDALSKALGNSKKKSVKKKEIAQKVVEHKDVNSKKEVPENILRDILS